VPAAIANGAEAARERIISQLGVFGSYVRGTQREDSDPDVSVDFRAPVGLMEFVGLKQEIGDAIGLAVDLVMKETLKRRIGQGILSEAVML
jgi:hypothetical protein